MKLNLKWTEGMHFEANNEKHTIELDAQSPIGKGSAPTPKELVGIGLAGCTAMDVIALMKKYKQPTESFEVRAFIEQTTGQTPAVFREVIMEYSVKGNVDAEKFKEAVMLSQTKYCGVSSMISKTCPITYRLFLNDSQIGEGQAHFG